MNVMQFEYDRCRGGFAIWFGRDPNQQSKLALNGWLKLFINADSQILGIDQMFADRGGYRVAGLELPEESPFLKQAPIDPEYRRYCFGKELRHSFARQGLALSKLPPEYASYPEPNLYDFVDAQTRPKGIFPMNDTGAHYGTAMVRVIQNQASVTLWFGGLHCENLPPTHRDEQNGISLWLYCTRLYGIRLSFRCLAARYPLAAIEFLPADFK